MLWGKQSVYYFGKQLLGHLYHLATSSEYSQVISTSDTADREGKLTKEVTKPTYSE